MPKTASTILALDFDGVLCDGLEEYFLTTWRTYCQIWQPANQDPPEQIAPVFYRMRPVIETGWEMPLLLRAILQGVPEEEILLGWLAIAQQLLKTENLQTAELGQLLDKQRDQWISTDLASWLEYHRFYPGVVQRVRSLLESPVEPVIITTKEERFVRKLLQQQGIEFSKGKIYGKGRKNPKYETLRKLRRSVQNIWFIEDRLKTLQQVQQQPDLEPVRLYLANWGYNTSSERESVRNQERIQLLSLEQFVQDFSAWP